VRETIVIKELLALACWLEPAEQDEWLDIPEFQRPFEWKPGQVLTLARSLLAGYPVGALVAWKPTDRALPKARSTLDKAGWFLLDGQQRATSICLLFNQRPGWFSEEAWIPVARDNTVWLRVDLASRLDPAGLAVGSERPQDGYYWVRLSEAAQSASTRRAALTDAGVTDAEVLDEHFEAVSDLVEKLKQTPVPLIAVRLETPAAVDAFERLNREGRKVDAAALILAITTVHRPGFITEQFDPLVSRLREEYGLDIPRSVMVKGFIACWLQVGRFDDLLGNNKDVRLADVEAVGAAWAQYRTAWLAFAGHLRRHGLRDLALLSGDNYLVPLLYVFQRWPEADSSRGPLRWLLVASRNGYYRDNIGGLLELDLKAIQSASSFDEAIAALIKRVTRNSEQHDERAWDHFTVGDLTEQIMNRPKASLSFRFAYYVMMKGAGLVDWKTGRQFDHRHGLKKDRGPEDAEWHHVFPKKALKGWKADGFEDVFANIALVTKKTNEELGSSAPCVYLQTHEVPAERLLQQYLDSQELNSVTDLDGYLDFLDKRAEALAAALNSYWGLGPGE
jgi:hypothetical protein